MVLGKEPDPATMRATAYQAEASAVLLKHHWKIVSDRPGRLVADQAYKQAVNFFGPQVFTIRSARLTLEFAPETTKHTKCKAIIVGYGQQRKMHEDKLGFKTYTSEVAGPFPLDTPDNVKEIQTIMAEAEKRLGDKQSEFAGR